MADAPEPCPIANMETSTLITLYSHVEVSKKRNVKTLRDQRLTAYFLSDPRGNLGDALLKLPRYSYSISDLQCYLRCVIPEYYYISLSGSLVGLSFDPSFTSDDSENNSISMVQRTGPLPKAIRAPLLLDQLPVCKNIGLGIVHSVDLHQNCIVIITPLDEEEATRVNTLVLSTQQIPHALVNHVAAILH